MKYCPYCGASLEKVPQRKTKCPSCGHLIYVRTRPSDKEQLLVTEDMAKQIDSEWAALTDQRKYERVLRNAGIDAREYDTAKRELTKKFGEPPGPRDIVWGVLNNHLAVAAGRKDWHNMKMLYFELAAILWEEGGDFFPILQEVRRCELRHYQSLGDKSVEILAGSCEKCRPFNGKVLTIKEALDTMPVPVKECENENGWCRCMYTPTID
jgi:DNA-directed RNA polymerase subunit RPC12/RpoP